GREAALDRRAGAALGRRRSRRRLGARGENGRGVHDDGRTCTLGLHGRAPVRSTTILVALGLVFTPTLSGGQTSPKTSAAPAAQPPAALGAPKAKDAKDDNTQPLTVDADKMERFGKASLVIFSGNVVARRDNSVEYADRVEVYMDEKGDRIMRTVSTGSVRIITKDCRTGTAQRAEYFDLDQRVVLSGNARVWQDDNVVSGDTITIYVAQDHTIVEAANQKRVKAAFYHRKAGRKDGRRARRPAPEAGRTDQD